MRKTCGDGVTKPRLIGTDLSTSYSRSASVGTGLSLWRMSMRPSSTTLTRWVDHRPTHCKHKSASSCVSELGWTLMMVTSAYPNTELPGSATWTIAGKRMSSKQFARRQSATASGNPPVATQPFLVVSRKQDSLQRFRSYNGPQMLELVSNQRSRHGIKRSPECVQTGSIHPNVTNHAPRFDWTTLSSSSSTTPQVTYTMIAKRT